MKKYIKATAFSMVGMTLAASAWAQSADWATPLSEGATELSDQLVQIGAPIIGLCIAGFGVWSVLTGRVDFNRLWMFLFGGALIGLGPQFGKWLMELFQ